MQSIPENHNEQITSKNQTPLNVEFKKCSLSLHL